jgi:hypothetical protein
LGQAPGGQAFASPGGTIDGDNHGKYELTGRGEPQGRSQRTFILLYAFTNRQAMPFAAYACWMPSGGQLAWARLVTLVVTRCLAAPSGGRSAGPPRLGSRG